jgi:DNA-binding response OmpR family regulator
MQPGRQFSFARYTVDLDNAQLWRGKQAIALTSQTFAVLRYLVEHAGQVVTKAELFEALWPGTAVSYGVLTFCIVELRKTLGIRSSTRSSSARLNSPTMKFPYDAYLPLSRTICPYLSWRLSGRTPRFH